MLLVEPPDAFDGPNAGGYPRRTAAWLPRFPQFPGFNSNPIESGDPHAMTVPYDVEALWVLDDCDSVWREKAANARTFYPAHKNRPGVDDEFDHGFYHDFNADYWSVTGIPVVPLDGQKRLYNTGAIAPGGVIPRELNSGVAGMQVGINAQVGQTILVRVVGGAYNSLIVKFPVDVVVIAIDGRPLGVPPFGMYNWPFVLPAGRQFVLSTARRFDVLIRAAAPVNSHAIVHFVDTRVHGLRMRKVVQTARIPIVIN